MIKNLEKNIIKFEDNNILKIMFGVFHKNLEIIEKELNVTLFPRGNIISINGEIKNILIIKTFNKNTKKRNLASYRWTY